MTRFARWKEVDGLDCRLGWAVLLMSGLMGCESTGSFTRAIESTLPAGPVESMAVVAECDVAKQGTQEVPGILVQVVLLDAGGKPVAGNGTIAFSLYREVTTDRQVEPDDQFRYSAEDLAKSASPVSLGTVHNFWLPRRKGLDKASQLQLVTVYRPAQGEPLAQSNFVSSEKPEISITTRREGDDPATANRGSP